MLMFIFNELRKIKHKKVIVVPYIFKKCFVCGFLKDCNEPDYSYLQPYFKLNKTKQKRKSGTLKEAGKTAINELQ